MEWFRHSGIALMDPRLRRLGRLLDVETAHARGLVASLLYWCSLFRKDGNLSDLEEDIEEMAGWEGPEGRFLRAAVEVGLLEWREGEPWVTSIGLHGEREAEAAAAGNMARL